MAQLVARLLWEQDAAGSNPVTSTICRYRLTVKMSDFQSEDVVSITITCSICCRGGIGIRKRLKHAFLWIRVPAAIPYEIVAELADAADLSSAGTIP